MSIYQSNYYVYAYIRKNGLPYYIGMGRSNRIWSKRKRVKPPKNKRYAIVVEENLTQIGAIALERRLIRWYGRKDNGTGILRNRTDGGESNPNLSSQTLQKMSNIVKTNWKNGIYDNIKRKDQSGKNNSFYGKTHSSDVIEKIRACNFGKKHSNETKKKMSESAKLNCQRPEAKELRSQIAKDRWKNPEFREKMRLKRMGKKRGPYKKSSLSDEHFDRKCASSIPL